MGRGMNIKLFYIIFLFVLGVSCYTPPKLINKEAHPIKINEVYKGSEDELFKKFIAPYSDSLNKTMNEVLVISTQPLTKDQPESLLGNMVADVVLKRARQRYKELGGDKVDACLLNNGGLRTSLPKGEITRGKIYELMPFENEMIVVTMSGKKMNDLLNYVAATNGVPLSGMVIGIRDAKTHSAFINGMPFDSMLTYKVVTSDYLGGGGDKMDFFKEPVKIEFLKYKLRDAIIDELKEMGANGKQLNVKLDGRVHHE
jgi:2',3'-cyclic-nucleotide 2'-phosphodiesterase (5'-nucleotidase family)